MNAWSEWCNGCIAKQADLVHTKTGSNYCPCKCHKKSTIEGKNKEVICQ